MRMWCCMLPVLIAALASSDAHPRVFGVGLPGTGAAAVAAALVRAGFKSSRVVLADRGIAPGLAVNSSKSFSGVV